MTGTVNGGYGDGAGRFTIGDDSQPAGSERWITKDYSVPTGTCSFWVKIGGTVTRNDAAFSQTSTNVITSDKTIGSAHSQGVIQRNFFPDSLSVVHFAVTLPAGTKELATVFDLALSGDEDTGVDGYYTEHDFGTVTAAQEFWVECVNEGTAVRFIEGNNVAGITMTAGLLPLSAANTDPFSAMDSISEGASLGGDGALVFRAVTTGTNVSLHIVVFLPIEAGDDGWQVGVLPL